MKNKMQSMFPISWKVILRGVGSLLPGLNLMGVQMTKGFIFLCPLPLTMSSLHSLTHDNILGKSFSILFTFSFFFFFFFFFQNPVWFLLFFLYFILIFSPPHFLFFYFLFFFFFFFFFNKSRLTQHLDLKPQSKFLPSPVLDIQIYDIYYDKGDISIC